MEELRQQLEEMSPSWTRSWSVFDLSAREEYIAQLEKEASSPGFWDDAQAAQRKMQELGQLQHSVELWHGLRSQVTDLLELTSLAIESGDESVADELTAETAAAAASLARAEMELTLSGPYDDRPAILTIHSGAGGTDSHDWVEMLTGMYSNWASLSNRPVQVLNTAYGDEAGLRTSTLEIGGQHAFGYLNAEVGVHRLVRISPFDPARRRQTSFARVEVLPAADDDDSEVELRSDDLKMDFFRSSGPGRPKCPESRVGRQVDPRAYGYCRLLPDRAVTTPEPRLRDEDPEGEVAGLARRGTRPGVVSPARRAGLCRVG